LAALPSSSQAPPAGTPLADTIDDSNATLRLGRLYFGGSREPEAVGPIQSWPMEEEPLIATAPARDPDIKRSALVSPQSADFNFVTPSATPVSPNAKSPEAGESVAAKGEVTGPGRRPKTPAERLGLDVKHRAKSEKCLAEAVYFESRGEPKRGQIAVAQVVMNRVFSGFYPTNVCGVVYQNANRKLACQFTFACDGIPDVVTEPDMWKQAKDIARDMLDGKLWLPEIGHSTHYHAYWVHPSWVNEMKKLYKIGVHSFYRPRAWGDGSDVPPLNQSQAQSTDNAAKKAKL
jgi:spore germination cell wall hydrolase CwlJ-like protein